MINPKQTKYISTVINTVVKQTSSLHYFLILLLISIFDQIEEMILCKKNWPIQIKRLIFPPIFLLYPLKKIKIMCSCTDEPFQGKGRPLYILYIV